MASHELKTPLTAISGYAELLENDMVAHDQVPHVAEQIRHNSDRLLSLINDIIRLSELDHNELPRKFTTMDLASLAEECCRNLSVSARARSLYLTCKGDSALLSADRDLLKELIENLIQNAIQYNRENGSILVRTGQNATITGLGIAILPRRMVQPALDSGQIITMNVEDLDFRRSFYIIHHKDKFLMPSAKKFIDLCRESVS